MAGKAGAQRGISAKVLKYMLENPGAYVRVEDLAYQFEATEQQVANAVSYIIREGKLPGLKSVQNGHVWQYEPEAQEDPSTVMHVIGHASDDGIVVLQDNDGSLWAAKRVKF
jgi:hypothetical protein